MDYDDAVDSDHSHACKYGWFWGFLREARLPETLGTTDGTLTVPDRRKLQHDRSLRRSCTGLENRSALTGTQGSNPCLSAFINAEKHSVFAETSGFPGVSLPLWPSLLPAAFCTLSCNSVQTCANPCELDGTIRGTSAPLTGRFSVSFLMIVFGLDPNASSRNRHRFSARHIDV